MVYSQAADVRTEAGNLPNTEISDALILLKQKAAYSLIQLSTHRTLANPFTSGAAEYGAAVEIETKLAAAYLLKMYQEMDAAKELEAEGKELLVTLIANLSEAGEPEADILIAVTPYLSYGAMLEEDPNNPLLATYRSGLTDTV